MNKKALQTLEYPKILSQLAHYAVSSMGKDKARALTPSIDREEIQAFQRETSDAASMIIRKGGIPLGGLKDIRAALKRVRIGGILSMEELLHIADVLRVCHKVKSYAQRENEEEGYPSLEPLFQNIQPLPHLEKEITRCIISEEEMADEASSALRDIRRKMKNLQERVKQQLHNIIHSSRYKNMLQDSVVTIRNQRYCVPIKQEYRSSFPGMVHDQSATGSTVFMEPMAVVQMNNELKESQAQEAIEIEKILQELSAMVAENLDILESNLSLLTQLDFIFAKGQLSLHMRGSEPIFNNQGRIYIKKARHPLLNPETVVPIDIYLGKDFTTLVITGPNTGGKTVTLKTLGLFTLMGQSGLHIPAFDGSELSVFDEVFADIGDEQSIEQSLSTFSSHMTNIVNILEEVTDQSLVLFDELGAGTDPTEGAALAMSILQYLHQRQIRTVATTHYSELKVYALSTEGIENASCEFDVHTLRPTYRLLIGIPGKSNAFAISRRLGLPEYIINDAKEFLEHEDVHFEDVITDLEISRKAVLAEQEKAARYRKEVEGLKVQIEDQKQKIQQQKDKILREAREQARQELQEAKDEADRMIQEMRKSFKEHQLTLSQKRLEEGRAGIREKLEEVEGKLAQNIFVKKNFRKPLTNVQPGQEVFLPSFNQRGSVLTLPDDKGEVMVQVGIIKMKIHLSQLTLSDTSVENKKTSYSIRTAGVKSKAQNISPELDVRGEMVEEAIENVDKYLDDVYLSKLPQVTIIHGKGTGALRQAIQQHLKRHPLVKSYRLGKFGEGESGVTIIEMKK